MRPIIGVNGGSLWPQGAVCHSLPPILAPRSHGKPRSRLRATGVGCKFRFVQLLLQSTFCALTFTGPAHFIVKHT